MPETLFCSKSDRHTTKLRCGHPLPCPWHMVIIDTAGPRVIVPQEANISKKAKGKIRDLAIKISEDDL